MRQRGRSATFVESHAPPWWLRVLVWGVPLGIVPLAWVSGGSGSAAGAAVAAAAVLPAVLSLEIGQRMYGHVRVAGDRVHVGRRSVPASALDFSTLRFEAGLDTFAVFGQGQLVNKPMWMRDTVALDGRHDGRAVQFVVGTNRRDELVTALRAAAAADAPDG